MADILKSVQTSNTIIHLRSRSHTPDDPIIHINTIPEDTAKQACVDAYQAGLNQGLTEGAARERAHLEHQTQALQTLLLSIPEEINTHRLHLSTEIADIVLIIAQQFFITQQQDKASISNQINQMLSQLNHKQNIEISLHPQDLALLQQGEISLDLKAHKNVRFKVDEQLRLGGCIVHSKHGVFDGGIERQIDNLKQVLLEIKQAK